MFCLAISLFLPLVLLGVNPIAEDWKAGTAIVKITPDVPVQMSGYASRTKPYEGINDDLYAKALALEDSQGHKGVIITSDLIGFTASISEPICKRISLRTGLKRENILITSIHTHSAPTLSLDPKPRENYPADDARNTANYTKSLQNKVADLAVRALVK